MPTKVNGPLMEDYKRALKAAKGLGAKVVRVEIGERGYCDPIGRCLSGEVGTGPTSRTGCRSEGETESTLVRERLCRNVGNGASAPN